MIEQHHSDRNLRTLPFIASDDPLDTGWEEWLEEIEREFRFFRIKDAQDKKDALISFGGKEIARLEKSIPNSDNSSLDEYQKLREKLNGHFAPKRNKHYARHRYGHQDWTSTCDARYMFLKMKPIAEESTASYVARLREKAVNCQFADEDDRILEHVIQTTDNKALIKGVIIKSWTLQEMLQEMQCIEASALQVNEMSENHRHVNRISRKNKAMKRRCRYCGHYKTHRKKEDCKAFGKRCRKCRKWQHFASECESSKYRQEVREIGAKCRSSSSSSSSEHSRISSNRSRCYCSNLSDCDSESDESSAFILGNVSKYEASSFNGGEDNWTVKGKRRGQKFSKELRAENGPWFFETYLLINLYRR